jgi:uncharacterized membrane protein
VNSVAQGAKELVFHSIQGASLGTLYASWVLYCNRSMNVSVVLSSGAGLGGYFGALVGVASIAYRVSTRIFSIHPILEPHALAACALRGAVVGSWITAGIEIALYRDCHTVCFERIIWGTALGAMLDTTYSGARALAQHPLPRELGVV